MSGHEVFLHVGAALYLAVILWGAWVGLIDMLNEAMNGIGWWCE